MSRKREPYPGFDWSWVPTPETPALLFDIETDGLLDETSTIHCICAKDFLTGESFSFGPGGIEDGLKLLSAAPLLVAHNGLCFDIPAIQKLHPSLLLPRLFDTLTASRLIWTNLKDLDFTQLRKKSCRFPPKLAGSHSLDAWGQRLGVMKGDYGKTTENAWNQWSEDMQRYCEQDVEVLEALYRHILDQRYSPEALALEHEFQAVIFHQERTGVWFDERAAQSLYAELAAKRNDAVTTLQEVFPKKRIEEIFIPKANNRTRGYVKGVPFTKVRYEPFNPASRQQIADRLMEKHGWKPSEFTDTGQPKVDEDVLASLPFPECKPLVDYLELLKIIGMLAEGKNGWLKVVGPDGRIHGRVITNGAVTGRCTHNSPNLAQIPARGQYGKQCRALFAAPPPLVQVGADASGLELRMLAHYLAAYDGGAYAKVLLEGDIHTANQHAAGLETRDNAKTFIYAFLYGAGDEKLGSIVAPLASSAVQTKRGRALKDRFFRSSTAAALLPVIARHKTAHRRRAGRPHRTGQTPLPHRHRRAAPAYPLLALGPEHAPAIRRGRAHETRHGHLPHGSATAGAPVGRGLRAGAPRPRRGAVQHHPGKSRRPRQTLCGIHRACGASFRDAVPDDRRVQGRGELG